MPRMIQCLYRGNVIPVQEALEIRDDLRIKNKTPDFRCDKCDRPVKPHKASKSGIQSAHFEHFEINPDCPRFA